MKTFILDVLVVLFLVTACHKDPVNPVEDNTPPLQEYATGLIKLPNRAFGVLHWRSKNFKATPLPDDFNWEDQGFETPVRDQRSCGSCWAFGGTQSIEMGYKIFGQKNIDFSEQELVSKLYSGCGGGYFVFDYQISHGQTDEASCPYTASNKKCASSIRPVGKGIAGGLVGQPNREPTDEELQIAIQTYGAVAATVGANNSFMNLKGGFNTACPSAGTNHIIALTGWKKNPADGKIYFKIKNSWNTGWGKDGYAYVRRGCWNLAEEASWLAVDAVPCKPPVVKLPAQYIVNPGDEIILAVKKIEGVTYAWYEGQTRLADGNELDITPTHDSIYRVTVKNQCGEGEVQTMVTLKN